MGQFKVSLHPTMFQAALTKESGATRHDTGARVFRTWPRPTEYEPGGTAGPRVVVPHVPATLAMRPAWFGEYRKTMYRAPFPTEGQMVVFETWLFAPMTLPLLAGPSVPVGYLGLRNGGTAWITCHVAPMPDGLAERIENRMGDPVWVVPRESSEDYAGVLLEFETPEDGIPIIIDMPCPVAYSPVGGG